MGKKSNFTLTEIIVIFLILVLLVILLIPLMLKTIDNYEMPNLKLQSKTVLMSAFEEYTYDTNKGYKITAYCYDKSYGYQKTLNGGTVKTIRNLVEDVSYYIEFDSEGYVIDFLMIGNDKAIHLSGFVNERLIDAATEDSLIDMSQAEILLEKCSYNSN